MYRELNFQKLLGYIISHHTLTGAYARVRHGGLAPPPTHNGCIIVHIVSGEAILSRVLKIVENLWAVAAPPEPRWGSSQHSPIQIWNRL